MADKISKEQRRKNMQAVKSSKTRLENSVTQELWNRGYRFRQNTKDLLGKPDIAIKKYKLVIFIDSCFWHKCALHYKVPKTNNEFWEHKINSNVQRDKKINEYYKNKNWNLLRVWEHDIKSDTNETLKKIIDFIETAKN